MHSGDWGKDGTGWSESPDAVVFLIYSTLQPPHRLSPDAPAVLMSQGASVAQGCSRYPSYGPEAFS